MNKSSMFFLLIAICLLTILNPDQVGQLASETGGLILALSVLFIVVLYLPMPTGDKFGYYRATVVSIGEDGTNQVWQERFNRRWIAGLMALRMACRNDLLGQTAYSVSSVWFVEPSLTCIK